MVPDSVLGSSADSCTTRQELTVVDQIARHAQGLRRIKVAVLSRFTSNWTFP